VKFVDKSILPFGGGAVNEMENNKDSCKTQVKRGCKQFSRTVFVRKRVVAGIAVDALWELGIISSANFKGNILNRKLKF